MSQVQAAWDACPLWGVFIATVVLVLLSIEGGLRLGHTERVTVGLQHRISPVIWTALYFTAALSMVAVGYQFGLSGARNVPMSVLLALTFSAVILLIADLDRATEGTLQVSLQPMLDLHKSLSGDAP
jgi:hypothetical protein